MQDGIVGLLWRRKRLLLLSGAACAALGFGVAEVLPQSYLGEGSLIVENKPSVADGMTSPSAISNVLTQVDWLQSKGLIQRVVRDLNLVHATTLEPSSRLPVIAKTLLSELRDQIAHLRQSVDGPRQPQPQSEFDKTVLYVQKHLTASAKEGSSVITVQFLAGSPETAASVANAVMSAYLTSVNEARNAQMAQAEEWISQQIDLRRQDVTAAERKITNYARAHNLAVVEGGSHVTAVQLSADQKQLVAAREDLAKKEAALNTVLRGGIASAAETLGSKTIEGFKDAEAKQMMALSTLATIDPRREAITASLNAMRAKIAAESKLIQESLARDVQVARAKVDALSASISTELTAAQDSTVAGAEMRQLMGDLDAKRQLYVTFFSQAGQARVAAEQTPTAHMLFTALPPERPFRTFGAMSLMAGFFCGVAGASAMVVLRGLFRPRISSTDDIAIGTGLPIFGSLPDIKLKRASVPLVTETFRAMWVSMRPQQKEAATILVTSSQVGEGKTTVAISLARRFADDNFRVLLIDADLRRPGIASAFGVTPIEGVETVVRGMALDQAITTVDGVDCLFAIGRMENPIKTLSSDGFAEIIATAKRSYDFVILDSPPVLHVADPVLLAKLCHHVLFIVQAGRLSADLVKEATRRFAEPDRNKMKMLLTRVRPGLMDSRDYYTGYTLRRS